jgi:pSer/pThr/pTyr-binding forkhead associated (FHA) protein
MLLVLWATWKRRRTATMGVPRVARPGPIVYSGWMTEEFPLGAQGLAIGRSRGNDVQLEGNTVSRQHVAIRTGHGQLLLQD